MPFVEASIVIKADPDDVFEFARNQEKFSEYMRDVESVKVLEKKSNFTITEWVTNVDGTPIIWTEEDVFDAQKRIISYKLIEGDMDKFEGTWSFTPNEGGTKVVLGVDFDFGIPHLEELIGPTLKTKVKENSDMMLQGMKQFFEGEVASTEGLH